MSIEHTLDSLEAEALIGAGWDRVAEALNTLREELNEMPEEGAACDKLFLLNNICVGSVNNHTLKKL